MSIDLLKGWTRQVELVRAEDEETGSRQRTAGVEDARPKVARRAYLDESWSARHCAWYRYCLRPRASHPTACTWPRSSRQIQTSSQAGGTAIVRTRAIASGSWMGGRRRQGSETLGQGDAAARCRAPVRSRSSAHPEEWSVVLWPSPLRRSWSEPVVPSGGQSAGTITVNAEGMTETTIGVRPTTEPSTSTSRRGFVAMRTFRAWARR